MYTFAAQRRLYHPDIFRVTAQRHIASARAVLGEQRADRTICEQDVPLCRKKDQPFIHPGGNIVKFRLPALEFVHLGIDFMVLFIHAVQQRR